MRCSFTLVVHVTLCYISSATVAYAAGHIGFSPAATAIPSASPRLGNSVSVHVPSRGKNARDCVSLRAQVQPASPRMRICSIWICSLLAVCVLDLAVQWMMQLLPRAASLLAATSGDGEAYIDKKLEHNAASPTSRIAACL